MPSSSGWSSFFHVGAKTWRPKTADQSYLEFEKKKFAEEAERKEAEVKQKIELLDQVRKLEAKTQALNEMALSAEMQTKEHELAMRERQMGELKQVELAKLELAKRMGEESLNEADFARIRRERMKAELIARQSNDHALRELDRASGQSEIDHHMATQMPMRGQTPMAGPIPMPGSMQTTGPMPIPGPMSMPAHMFMPGPMSMPGQMHMPHMSPQGPHPAFDHQGGMPMAPHARLRGRSESFSIYPGDMGRNDWGPNNNLQHGQGLRLSDHLDRHRIHQPNRDFPDHHESVAFQMAIRAQAELIRRRKEEQVDQAARQHELNAQAMRQMRKQELVARLQERGMQQRQIEAEAAMLYEQDRRRNAAQLREERDREYRLMLKEKGLQEREIVDQLKRREAKDRESLRKEVQRLEREIRHQGLREAESAIWEARRNRKGPPMGIGRPSIEQIQREGLLEHMWAEFHELHPRLQQEIISMENHYKPGGAPGKNRSRAPSMGNMNSPHLSRAPTPRTRENILQQMGNQLEREDSNRANMRPGSKASSRDHDHGPSPLSRHNSTPLSNRSPGPSQLRNRPPSRGFAAGGPPLSVPRHEFESESFEQISSTGDSAFNDAALAARLQSAALNSEINGGRRSRAGSLAGQMNADHPMSRHRPDLDPSPLNPNVGRRSRASTLTEQMESEFLRSGLHHMSSELGSGRRSRSNSTSQSFGISPESRMMNNGLGRSPGGSDHDFVAREEGGRTRNSRPPSRANPPGTSYSENRFGGSASREPSQMPTDRPSSRQRPETDPNSLAPSLGRSSRTGTISEQIESDLLRGNPNHVSSEFGSDHRSRSSSRAPNFGTSPQSRMMNERHIHQAIGRTSAASNHDFAQREQSRPPSRLNMSAAGYNENRYNNLTNEQLSQIPTEELQMLLASGQVDPSTIQNKPPNLHNLRPEEIDQMSSEELDALLRQCQESPHVGMSNSNADARQSQMVNTGMGGASSSSGSRPHSSMNRGAMDSSRSSSRAGTSGIHQSGLERQNSRNNCHSTSPLNPSNRNSPSNPKSLYSMLDERDRYEGQNNDTRSSSQDNHHYHQTEEDLDDGDFIITEMREQPGVQIVQELGRVEASSRDGSNYSRPIDGEQIKDRDEMHQAVKNLIAEASQRGANGVVSLRVNDLKDGSYVASGEAVVFA
ncbi:hypothetical protein MJO29_008984 [Puccinia striiformis f. sp. tritici]|nr:hypothetical protein Pst134EB_018684 [Puccinia striiformis f. sp. tritici]KAI7950310.1 hypothetical protein MJO29_008984 [Puccinia striiformis f. sp. tritici]